MLGYGVIPSCKYRTAMKTSLKQFNSESKAWLTACLDPFHDFQYDVVGLPDERSAPSVVQVHNQNLTVSSNGYANNWDASICFTGVDSLLGLSPVQGGLGGYRGGLQQFTNSRSLVYSSTAVSDGTAGGSIFGSLIVHTTPSGSGIDLLGNLYGSASGTLTSNFLGDMLNTDRARLIGVGIEIHNTTAEIYKQGSVTIAQLPDAANDSNQSQTKDTTASWTDSTIQCDRVCKLARTVDQLRSVPGSTTWSAAEGCYVIPRMTTVPRDTKILTYGTAVGTMEGAGSNSRLPLVYIMPYGTDAGNYAPSPVGFSVATHKLPLFYPYSPNSFSPVQIYFSGLSPQTNLTLTFRTIVEYFPAIGSPLLPLANPSPAFDPKALAVYSQIAMQAPFAVPVDQNEAGEYFRKIMFLLSRVLDLSSPLLGSAAPVASAVGKFGANYFGGKKIDRKATGTPARISKKK